MKINILIPVYQPNENFISLILGIINIKWDTTIFNVIIVNDGSDIVCHSIFDKLYHIKHCTIIHHAVNLGKGRAIKTGLNYILYKNPDIHSVITVDADGQHLVKDITKIIEQVKLHPKKLVIGYRKFNKKTPLRNKIGNLFTIGIFRIVSGIKIFDTQTGLRGIPRDFIPICVNLSGERYEYETNMLLATTQNQISITQVKIHTIYINNNESSHFQSIRDSFLIYFILLRFGLSSALSSTIDMITFYICIVSNLTIIDSIVIARLIAGNCNFFLNKKIVFKKHGSWLLTFSKYWILVVILGGIAYSGINLLVKHDIMPVLYAKILIESFLFICSFSIQRDFIFYKRN